MDYWKTPIDEFFLNDKTIMQDSIDLLNKEVPLTHQGVSFNLYDSNSKFFEWVLTCVKIYLKNNYNEYCECYVDRAWAITQPFGMNNEIHSHAPFHLAVVYYLNANQNHPDLELFDPRPPHIFNNVYRKLDNGTTMGGCRSIKIKAETGKLVIFPGYLLHGVGTNMSQEPRVCIAMNVNVKI